MTQSEWIPFTIDFARGSLRGLPRAVRYVLLDVGREARRRSGVIDLAPELSTVDALHDLLGGERGEIEAAVKVFEASGEFVVERGPQVHRVTLTRWSERFGMGLGSSTDRVRKHRDAKKSARVNGGSTPETLHVTPGNVARNVTKRPIVEESRKEERRDLAPPAPPPPPPVDRKSETRATPLQTPGYDLARTVWLSEWMRRHGEAYVLNEKDHARLASLGAAAVGWAETHGDEAERFIRSKVRGLLSEGGRAAEARHPLGFLDMNSTPAPKVRRPRTDQPSLPMAMGAVLGPALSRAIPRWSDVVDRACGPVRRVAANE